MGEGDFSPLTLGDNSPIPYDMSIPEFIARCDAYCKSAGVSRRWLSKRLFTDTFRLEQLAGGSSDVGVNRLARAIEELARIEAERSQDAAA
jgi:hypothetical protein